MTRPDDAIIRTIDRPGDLGWVVMAHGEVYAAEFPVLRPWLPGLLAIMREIMIRSVRLHGSPRLTVNASGASSAWPVMS